VRTLARHIEARPLFSSGGASFAMTLNSLDRMLLLPDDAGSEKGQDLALRPEVIPA